MTTSHACIERNRKKCKQCRMKPARMPSDVKIKASVRVRSGRSGSLATVARAVVALSGDADKRCRRFEGQATTAHGEFGQPHRCRSILGLACCLFETAHCVDEVS